MDFDIEDISILLINDQGLVFCPILNITVPHIKLKMVNKTETMSYTDLELDMKIHYFNAVAGDWEPFIEQCFLKMKQQQIKDKNLFSLECTKPILINVTTPCI